MEPLSLVEKMAIPVNKFLLRLEKPFLISYATLWVAVYLLSRFNLELYTDHASWFIWLPCLLVILPISLYAMLRTKSANKGWYEKAGIFVMYTLFGLFSSIYIIVNGDLMISAADNRDKTAMVKLTEVRKVFYKSGFDHTSVTVETASGTVVLQGRPFIYFYLNDKKIVLMRSGRSYLGNEYFYTVDIGRNEKFGARWLHFKDQLYRLWVFIAIIAVMIIIGLFWPERLSQKKVSTTSGWGFWKLMGFIMAILFAIFLLLYLGLLVYVKFFAAHHR